MELDKRVEEIETELKVVKGEIKELLVDIRDLVNKSENPFCNSQKHGVFRLETKEKEVEAGNQTPAVDEEESDLKPSDGVPETGLENEKNKECIPEPTRHTPKKPSPAVPEQNMPRQKTPIKEMQAIEPEIPVRKIDTFTLVELMRWADYAVRTIGHSNLEVLLDLYALTGQLSEETKYVIENIATLSIEEPAGEDRVSMKDNITVLSQLNAILNPGEFRNIIQQPYEDSGWRKEKRKTGLVSN